MKNKNRAVVIEDFTRQIIDPMFDKRYLFIGNVIKRLSFREEAANKRVLLFVCTSFVR